MVSTALILRRVAAACSSSTTRFWQRAFGAAPDVLGRTVTIAGRPATIVGVLAAESRLPPALDAYAPLEYDDTFSASAANGRRGEFLAVIGHARDGVDPAAIDEDLQRIGAAPADRVQADERRSHVRGHPAGRDHPR